MVYGIIQLINFAHGEVFMFSTYVALMLMSAPSSSARINALMVTGIVFLFVNNIGRPGQYQLGVAYAFMILVIVFKPSGLLGRASARRA